MTNREEIIIYPKRRGKVFLAVMCFSFIILWILAGLYLLDDDPLQQGRYYGLGVIALPILGYVIAYAVYRIVQHQPALIINDEGIYENVTLASLGMMRWEEIKHIFPYNRGMGARCLVIVPQNMDVILSRCGMRKRILFRIDSGLIDAIFIPQNSLTISTEELIEHIQKYHEVLPRKP